MEKLEQRVPQLSVAERLARMTPMERVKAVQTMSFAEMKEAAAWLETMNIGNKASEKEARATPSVESVEPSEAGAVEASGVQASRVNIAREKLLVTEAIEEVISTNTTTASEAPITEEETPRGELPGNDGNAEVIPEALAPVLEAPAAEEEPPKEDAPEDNTNREVVPNNPVEGVTETQVVPPPVALPVKRGRGRPRKYPRPDDINGLPAPRIPKTPERALKKTLKRAAKKTSKKQENKGKEQGKEEEEKEKEEVKGKKTEEEEKEMNNSVEGSSGETGDSAAAEATVAAPDVQARPATTEIPAPSVKRGRGRPRKHPRSEDVNGLPLPVPKKKRRRYIGDAAAADKDKDGGVSEVPVSAEKSVQSRPERGVHSQEVRSEEEVVLSGMVRSEEGPAVEGDEGEGWEGRLTQSEEDIIARINGTLRRCSLEVRLPSEGKEDGNQNAEGDVGLVGAPEARDGRRLVLDEVVIMKGGTDEVESGEVGAKLQAEMKEPLRPTITSPILLLDEVIRPPPESTPITTGTTMAIPTRLPTTIAIPIPVSPSTQSVMPQSIPSFVPPSMLPPIPTCPPMPHQGGRPPIPDCTPLGIVYRTPSAPSHWDDRQPPPLLPGHVESFYSNLNIPPDKMKQLEAWRNLGRGQINPPPPPVQGCFNVNGAGSASVSAIANGAPAGGQFHNHKMPVPAQWPAQAQPLPPVQRQREGAKREGEMDSVVVPFPKRQNVGTPPQSVIGMTQLGGIPSQLLGQMVIQPPLQWQAPESGTVEIPQASLVEQSYQELPSQPSQMLPPQKGKTPPQVSPALPHPGNQAPSPQNSPTGSEVPVSPMASATPPNANKSVTGPSMEIHPTPAPEAPASKAHVQKESYHIPSPPPQKKSTQYRPPLPSTPSPPAAGFLDTKTISTTFHAEVDDSPDGSSDKPKRTRKSSSGRVRRKGLKWVIYSGEQ
ncbi:hypothetical protein BGX38DRAFT_1153147 [Terfezia claveryi]|nr:hypothetical protein BGX38DRAFT_1153147 [Terfezia claveryi]